MGRENRIIIRTAEGIAFTLLPAGPIARSIAWAVDLACIMAILVPLSVGARLAAIVSPDWAQALGIVLFFIVSLGYAMVAEWRFKGQTVGKRLLSLRVVDAEGMPLQASQVIARNLLRVIDSLPLCYLVGGIACVVTRKSQRLGDFAAGTMVIREPRVARPDFEQVASHKYNSLREHRLLAARLRKKATPQASDIALQACLRRSELEPAARVELFTEIADYFKELVPLPKEVTEGIGAEQVVQDVVEILFTPDA